MIVGQNIKIFLLLGVFIISLLKQFYTMAFVLLLGYGIYKADIHTKIYKGLNQFLGIKKEHEVLGRKKKKFDKKFFSKLSDGKEI